MKLKVGTKIMLGFAAIMVLLVIMGITSIVSVRSIGGNVESISTINERLGLENQIEAHFYNGVAGIRGFIAYGRDNFAEAYTKNLEATLTLERRLLEIAPADKKEDVRRLIEVTETYHRAITNELIPTVRNQFATSDPQARQAYGDEVQRIAGSLTPVTAQLTEIVQELVQGDAAIFAASIKSTGDNVTRSVATSSIITVVALIIGVALSFFLSRSITAPIIAMVGGAGKMAQGDFTEEIKVSSSDEVGDLAKSLNDMSGQLKSLITGIINDAQTLAAHSEELAASAEEVSATVEEVASTTNEVASMAEKGMENAHLTAGESKKVIEVASSGQQTVGQAVDKINLISESVAKVNRSIQDLGELSAKIGNITDVITGIADQTNLLALNAAIEAARAGDQGRGFAVVAEEVRKLAEQSASAAKEIGQLINQIQSGVEVAIRSMNQSSGEVTEGVQLASEAGTSLDNIIRAVNNNISLVEEITTGAKQTSEGTQQLSASNEQVTSTIQQVAAATQQLADIAGRLQNSVAQFKV